MTEWECTKCRANWTGDDITEYVACPYCESYEVEND